MLINLRSNVISNMISIIISKGDAFEECSSAPIIEFCHAPYAAWFIKRCEAAAMKFAIVYSTLNCWLLNFMDDMNQHQIAMHRTRSTWERLIGFQHGLLCWCLLRLTLRNIKLSHLLCRDHSSSKWKGFAHVKYELGKAEEESSVANILTRSPLNGSKWFLDESRRQLRGNVIRNLKLVLRTATNLEHAAICKRYLTAVINSFSL